jgi:hypothetical protein
VDVNILALFVNRGAKNGHCIIFMGGLLYVNGGIALSFYSFVRDILCLLHFLRRQISLLTWLKHFYLFMKI